MMKTLALAGVAAAALVVAAVPADSARYALSAQDKAYMTKDGHGNHWEVAVGQIAMQKGGTTQIKTLGQALYRDHNASLKKLQALAKKLSFTLPDGPDGYQSKQLRAFANAKTKAQLDREIASAEVADHRQDISDAQKEASAGSNPAVKAFASASIPMLQKHLLLAQAAQRVGH
jgi:putative membrane protein